VTIRSRSHEDDSAEQTTRRSFIRWIGATGATLTAVAAGVVGVSTTAEAAPGCCGLRFPPGDPNYDCGTCNAPYHWTAWYCLENGHYRACGECTSGTTCNQGPFLKSCAWWAN
jgi:hypothetical protein